MLTSRSIGLRLLLLRWILTWRSIGWASRIVHLRRVLAWNSRIVIVIVLASRILRRVLTWRPIRWVSRVIILNLTRMNTLIVLAWVNTLILLGRMNTLVLLGRVHTLWPNSTSSSISRTIYVRLIPHRLQDHLCHLRRWLATITILRVLASSLALRVMNFRRIAFGVV